MDGQLPCRGPGRDGRTAEGRGRRGPDRSGGVPERTVRSTPGPRRESDRTLATRGSRRDRVGNHASGNARTRVRRAAQMAPGGGWSGGADVIGTGGCDGGVCRRRATSQTTAIVAITTRTAMIRYASSRPLIPLVPPWPELPELETTIARLSTADSPPRSVTFTRIV